jgi:hypothetical protein
MRFHFPAAAKRLVVAGALLIASEAMAAPMQQAFLVQNSGWMEPFYTDPASQLKPLVSAVISAVATPEDPVFISAFNQSTPDNLSPALVQQGVGPGRPVEALAKLGVARKNKAGALADTDFQEAVTRTIEAQFKAKPGIIWIFTNNKNSPNNDAQTALRNKDFYELLHVEPSIARSLAFPLKMPVKGATYNASGMMVYALAYGEEASAHLAQMVDDGKLNKVFTGAPARLKPIDQDAVRLVPTEVFNAGATKVSLAKDGRTLIVDIEASSALPRIDIKAKLENLFYPYAIDGASASAVLAGSWGEESVAITPQRFDRIQPGEQREVTVSLPVPLAQIPSSWSPVAMAAMGKQVSIPALLRISLSDQRLVISDGFAATMRELFPSDPLSEVFEPPQGTKSSIASIPLLVRIQYPLLPVVMAMLGLLTLVAAAIGVAVLAGRTARYDVIVDGNKRSVAVKAFSTTAVRAVDGTVVGSVRRGLGKPRITEVQSGHSVTIAR